MMELFLQHSISFFAILDPLGVTAIMMTLLPHDAKQEDINRIAKRTTITIVIAFFAVLLSGKYMLSLFAIEVDSLRTIGGLVLLLTALRMIGGNLRPKNQTPIEAKEAKESEDFSIIPLAIPITFGPGVFAAIVIYRVQIQSLMEAALFATSFLLNALLIYIIFRNAIFIRKTLGITGQKIVSRLMGLIVGAIAVQFIIAGIATLWMKYISKIVY